MIMATTIAFTMLGIGIALLLYVLCDNNFQGIIDDLHKDEDLYINDEEYNDLLYCNDYHVLTTDIDNNVNDNISYENYNEYLDTEIDYNHIETKEQFDH